MTLGIMDGRRGGSGRPRTQNSDSEPPSGSEVFQWPQFVQPMQQPQNQFMQQRMQQFHGGQQPQVTPQEVAGGDFWCFFRMNPLEFLGGFNPVEAWGDTQHRKRVPCLCGSAKTM